MMFSALGCNADGVYCATCNNVEQFSMRFYAFTLHAHGFPTLVLMFKGG
jgi:hypothetical protein